MVESKKYKQNFFDEMEINSIRSAKAILPFVNQLIHPQSVIDIGCGTGVWLNTWEELFSISDYLGIDGPYVKDEMLKIPKGKFLSKDLKEPLNIKAKYDLVMSLEVAEHLPASSAVQFVETLTSLGDIILFSAAIPGQTGTYHINEQYPEYWALIFRDFGFLPVDIIRPGVWNSNDVEFYYKQNSLLFVRKDILEKFSELKECAKNTDPEYLTRIHPFLLELKVRQINNTKTFWGYLNWRWYKFKRKYIFKDPSLNGT
jgi:SAM-dependent methyltransferase